MEDWHVTGHKVVCVDDFHGITQNGEEIPIQNKIYTIRSIDADYTGYFFITP